MNQTSWGQIEALILDAARRSPAERAELAERCEDEGLRATLGSVVTHTFGTPKPIAGPPISLQPGERVGPYVVAHRLGRGGMGEVFLARDSRLDRLVALKYLLPSNQGAHELQARITREARLAARISHANIATVHDVIEHGGRTFIVMEYVEGESLATVLRRETMPESRVVQIGRELAAALTAAHAVGIIHRDLKPANIQITPHGTVKVLDFGIATAYAAIAAAATTGSRPAARVEALTVPAGTLGYMAPEQLLGRPVDERSDIFSLAAVLYEMATGRVAFDVNDPLDNLVAIIHGAPRADGTGRQVTERVANIISRGLESDPAKRYRSAADMLAALEAISIGGAPAEAAWPRYVRVAGGVALVPLAIWAFGWMSCAVYNNTFGRSGAFAAETLFGYFGWGIKSLVAPFVYAVLAILTSGAVVFVLKLLMLVPAASNWHTSARVRVRTIADRLALNDPVMLAQGLASAGLIALLLIVWWFNPLIRAFGAFASTGDIVRLQPLGSDSTKLFYRMLLTVLLLGFSAGLLRVLQLRRRLAMQRGKGSVAALTLIVLCLLLLNEVPYRVMWGKSLRVEYRGARCYVIGESAAEYLLYCPRAAPQRNTILRKADLPQQKENIVENVFTQD
jgi:Protein kinase domain